MMSKTWASGISETIIFALLVLTLTFNYLTQTSDTYKYFNSDALTIYSFLADILNFNGRISAWNFSNAPSFVPDYLIGLAAALLSHKIYWQIFLSSLIQVGLLYYAIRRLAAPIVGRNGASYALLMIIIIMVMASKDISPYYQVFVLNWHFGTYLVGLYYLGVYVDIINSKGLFDGSKSPPSITLQIIGLCVLSFVMTLSDALFFMLFPVPLLMVGGYYLVVRRIHVLSYAKLFILPIISALLGHYSAPKIVPNFANLSLPITSSDNIFPKLIEVYNLLYAIGFPAFIIAAFFGWCLVLLIYWVRLHFNRDKTTQPESLRVFLVLFLIVSLGTSLVVVLVSTALVGDRYLPSLFFTPFIFLCLLAPALFQKTGVIRIAQFVFLLTFLLSSWPHRSAPLKTDYYPEQIACIDNATRDLKNPSGIGEYWLTKKLIAFSKAGVRMVSVNPDLKPYEVLVSNEWYRNNYNFAVINTAEPANSMYLLDEKLIENFNGKPDSVVSCQNAKVLVYKGGLSTTMDPERGSGIYLVEGCRLPRSTGTIDQKDVCSLKNSDASYAGNLSYGPYLKLPPGKYEFDLNYISANPAEQKIGYLDISFLLPENHQVISEQQLLGSGGNPTHLLGSLEVDQNMSRGQLEIRTFVEKNSNIEILSIKVSRIKSDL